jgi:putative hydrolase of the HAD superfamily
VVDTILFDFFGTLVKYSASRTIQEFSMTHEYVTKNIVSLEYLSFLEIWDKSFSYLEQQSRVSQLEFSMKDVVSEFSNRVGTPDLSESAKTELIDLFMNEWSSDICPFANLENLLDSLSSEYRLGIVSNTHQTGFVPELLTRFAISDYIDEVITSIDHGRPKPHESIYTAALSALGANAENTVFIGDSYEHDYLGPRQLGMHSILIAAEPPKEVPIEHVVSEINDIKEVMPNAT